MLTEPSFKTKHFDELTTIELHKIYLLRSKVFVVEQNCAYQDPDEKDLLSHHVMMTFDGELGGYCRIIPPGVSYKEACIGRVTVEKEQRHSGLGKKLMLYSMAKTLELYKIKEIVISAQCYLKTFYTDLGFVAEGENYLEDNIPHIKMRYLMK